MTRKKALRWLAGRSGRFLCVEAGVGAQSTRAAFLLGGDGEGAGYETGSNDGDHQQEGWKQVEDGFIAEIEDVGQIPMHAADGEPR